MICFGEGSQGTGIGDWEEGDMTRGKPFQGVLVNWSLLWAAGACPARGSLRSHVVCTSEVSTYL